MTTSVTDAFAALRQSTEDPGNAAEAALAAAEIADEASRDQAALVDWLRTQTWSEFAQDLARYFDRKGRLTERQEAAARSMREKVEVKRQSRSSGGGYPDVPAGRYAIEVNGEIKFYKVDRPTQGRWAGWTFVKVQASDEFYRVKGAAARSILEQIEQDPIEASKRYGREIGRCGVCNRTLTQPESIAAGIGPICAANTGF